MDPYIGHATRFVSCPGCHKLQPIRGCTYCETRREMKKSFLKSRTFWVNFLAGCVLIAQGITGNEVVMSLEIQALCLATINLVLRAVTREPIGW